MRIGIVVPFVLVAIFIASCAKPPGELVVRAGNTNEYSQWLYQCDRTLGKDDRHRVTETEKEMKLGILIDQEASGSDEVANAYYAKIDGKTLRQFFMLGVNARIHRLEKQRNEYAGRVSYQESLTAARDDTASADYLADRVKDSKALLEKTEIELSAAHAELTEFEKKNESGI